jgi:hypothetical protein
MNKNGELMRHERHRHTINTATPSIEVKHTFFSMMMMMLIGCLRLTRGGYKTTTPPVKCRPSTLINKEEENF